MSDIPHESSGQTANMFTSDETRRNADNTSSGYGLIAHKMHASQLTMSPASAAAGHSDSSSTGSLSPPSRDHSLYNRTEASVMVSKSPQRKAVCNSRGWWQRVPFYRDQHLDTASMQSWDYREGPRRNQHWCKTTISRAEELIPPWWNPAFRVRKIFHVRPIVCPIKILRETKKRRATATTTSWTPRVSLYVITFLPTFHDFA